MRKAGKSKYPELCGLSGGDYSRAWAKLFRVKMRRYKRAAARRKYAEMKAAGLTVRGTVPKNRRVWPKGTTNNQRTVVYERERRERCYAQGLNCFGQPRKYKTYPQLAGLSGDARRKARTAIWLQNRMRDESRSKVSAMIKGAATAVNLRRSL